MKDLIEKLANQRILVVGDVILDEYLIGQATRMSREAPVPVLEYESRRLIPGGAANPAANITALGSHAVQIGVTGADDFALQLCRVIRERGIDTAGLVEDATRPTTVKTRIMAQMGLRFPQQVARLDRLSREPISTTVEADILAAIERRLPQADALLFSDYHCGLLTPSLIAAVCERAAVHRVLLTADAQGEFAKYHAFSLVKCNADEARTYLDRELTTDADFAQAARDLCAALQLSGGMVITRGADGASYATAAGDAGHAPAPSVTDVYDTVGAGDTTTAVLTLAISGGATYTQATTLANYASGLVVRRVGNYAPSPVELLQAMQG